MRKWVDIYFRQSPKKTKRENNYHQIWDTVKFLASISAFPLRKKDFCRSFQSFIDHGTQKSPVIFSLSIILLISLIRYEMFQQLIIKMSRLLLPHTHSQNSQQYFKFIL